MSLNTASRVFFPEVKNHAATILLVEDEILIRMAIAAYLQECGFKVLEAGCAAEAMQVLSANAVPVDLVFTDVAMPGDMDGLGLMRWIHEYRPEIQIVMTSGDEARQPSIRSAINGHSFFAKPYDVGQVASRIRHLVTEPGHKLVHAGS